MRLLRSKMAAKGSFWSSAEVQCLLEIWADESIQEQLDNTYRNSEIYGRIRDYLLTRGYRRSTEQCRDKVKKLRAHYLKVRNVVRKSEFSAHEKDKFRWYDDVDRIIGLKPNGRPNVLESHTGKPAEINNDESEPPSDLSHTGDEAHSDAFDTGKLEGAAEGTLGGTAEGTLGGTAEGTLGGTAEGTLGGTAAGTFGGTAAGTLGGTAAGTLGGTAAGTLGGMAAGTLGGTAAGTLGGTAEGTLGGTAAGRLGGTAAGRLARTAARTPTQQRKKRKLKTDVSDMMATFLDIQKTRHDEFMRGEQLRRQQQMEMLDKWMKAQMEMEERRQQAQRAERQEANRMFQQMMSRLFDGMVPFFQHHHRKPLSVVLKDVAAQERAGVQDASKEEIQVLAEQQSRSLDPDTQQLRRIKDEEEETDISKFCVTRVTVTREEDETKPLSSQLQKQTQQNGEAEPPSVNLTQPVKTEPDREECEDPEPERISASDHRLELGTTTSYSRIHAECKEEEDAHYQDWMHSLDQKDTKLPHIKEEHEDVWTSQEAEHHQGPEEAEITMFPSATTAVKIEEEHPQQTENNRGAEPKTDGEECGGPEPASIWDPDTDDMSSDCSEPEMDVADYDWMENSDLHSGLFSLTDDDVPTESPVFISCPPQTSGHSVPRPSDQADRSGFPVGHQQLHHLNTKLLLHSQ